MKEQCINEIAAMFATMGIDTHEAKTKLYIIMNRYEITEMCTEVALYHEDVNQKYIQKFLMAKMVKGLTQRTLKAYKRTLVKALQRIGKDADQITADDIRYYIAIREHKDKATRESVWNEYRYLSTFFDWMRRAGFISSNPIEKIEMKRPQPKPQKAFTEMEIALLKEGCQNSKERCIVEMLLSTGCRVSELVGIKIADIDGHKIIVHGKGQKDRTVYLNANARLAISNYLREKAETSNPYLFPKGVSIMDIPSKYKKHCVRKETFKIPECTQAEGHVDISSVEQMIRKLSKRAGVKHAHPHKFRRTCATLALRRGMPIIQVSQMLGHNQLDTTKIYLDLTEKELEAAHEKYVY